MNLLGKNGMSVLHWVWSGAPNSDFSQIVPAVYFRALPSSLCTNLFAKITPKQVNKQDMLGDTPLMKLILCLRLAPPTTIVWRSLLSELLLRGADSSIQNRKGTSPLMGAAQLHTSVSDMMASIPAMIESGSMFDSLCCPHSQILMYKMESREKRHSTTLSTPTKSPIPPATPSNTVPY